MVWQNNAGVRMSAALTVCIMMFGSTSIEAATADDSRIVLIRHEPSVAANPPDTFPQDESLEAKMARRFPQKVKVGDLIGLPVLDVGNDQLDLVQQVVRSPEDKIKLIVTYSRWFGWFGRPVAVPVEAVAILGKQIASLEMPPAEYEKAPTWIAGTDCPFPKSEIIRIALTRR